MFICWCFFLFNQKTAYEIRISDWSSDVCSSDLNITIFGDGSRCQNYIHVEDAANMLIALGSSPKNGLFLGTGEQSYSNLEIARIVQEFTNCKIEFTGVDNTSSFSYNNGRIKHIRGEFYKFQGITEGLEQIVTWRIE